MSPCILVERLVGLVVMWFLPSVRAYFGTVVTLLCSLAALQVRVVLVVVCC